MARKLFSSEKLEPFAEILEPSAKNKKHQRKIKSISGK
jgi:hypothetical protein